MTIDQFLEGKPVQLTDLFGAWKCRGFDSVAGDASEKITKRLGYIRLHFAKYLKKNPMPAAATCKFKREDVNGKGDGEWLLVLDCNDQPLATFSASSEGFVRRDTEASVAEVKAPVKKSQTKETRTPKEIQDSIPLEERHSWFNYDLADKITEKLLAETKDEENG